MGNPNLEIHEQSSHLWHLYRRSLVLRKDTQKLHIQPQSCFRIWGKQNLFGQNKKPRPHFSLFCSNLINIEIKCINGKFAIAIYTLNFGITGNN